MDILNEKKINITPHKSIYRKMGRSSHGFNESVAELVDNSIDAMTEEQREGKDMECTGVHPYLCTIS